MANNVRYEKRSAVRLEMAVGAGKVAGAVEFLNDLGLFLLENSDSNNNATVELIGVGLVVDLAVTGADNVGNVAVAVGHAIYKDGVQYNRDATNGKKIGYALGTVTSGATATIQVALNI
jgi:hypothetical protein